MSEASRITQISENVNQGYIAGRDLYLGDQYVAQETLYFEPDLENVEPEAWVTTPKAEELLRSLATHRLIVLAGQDMEDKTRVARHLARLLREQLSGEVRVREWYRSSDPQKIETAFHASGVTILLLPQVLPHHLGHRLADLARVLRQRRNYAVVTTDGTRSDWGIRSGSDEEMHWQELSWETYYGRPFLAATLLQEIAAQNGHRPDWLPRDLHPGSLLAQGLTVEDVAARLKQPDRIERFAQWLQSEEASPRTLHGQLDQLGGDRAAIHRWYRQLTPTDQIFALALVLFDGLPDDQIFAAVEYVVDAAWRKTDPNLPLFDYRDLARLDAHFHLVASGEDGSRIETLSLQKREALLQASWELQRRRILAAVPALTRLVQHLSAATTPSTGLPEEKEPESTSWRRQLAQVGPSSTRVPTHRRKAAGRKGKPAAPMPEVEEDRRFTQGNERALLHSPRRIEQLQRSVIESLSQIGLLSFEAVEASFLELAADGSIGVQTVVAKALAAWRGEGHHDRLFQVLLDWWRAGARSTPPKALAGRAPEGVDPLAGIRATVAMAVGYALQYDPPNRLAPEVLSLLRVLVQDRHPAVRQRVLELTLPLAAASHPQQLEEVLRTRLGEDQEQMYAIAFGIAMAFSLQPLEALRTIDTWHLMVRSQGPRDSGDLTITPRDRLLATVAMIYGYLQCDPSQALLSPGQIVAALRSILTSETHPFVRTHTMMAIGLQGLQDFETVAPLLLEIIPEIALPDRANVVAVLVRSYLKQREQLRGGDGEVEAGGRTYSVWLLSPRPLTAIELALYSWLSNGDHPVARQIAAQTFASFNATELEQKERNLGATQKKNPAPAPPPSSTHRAANPPRLRRLPVLGYAAAHLAAPLQRQTRVLIRPVLAEMLDAEQSDSRAVSSLLNRWHASGDTEIQGLARAAARAYRFFQWRWVLILTQIFCVILLLNGRDWLWSHQDPLPLDDAMMMTQRRILPFRFALARGTSLVRPAPEKSEEPEPPEGTAEEPTADKEAEVKPPRIPADLSERLLWSAIRMLERRLDLLDPENPQGTAEIGELAALLHAKPELSPEQKAWVETRILSRIFAEMLLKYLRDPKGFQKEMQRHDGALREIDRAFPGARARILTPPPGLLPLAEQEEESAEPAPGETRLSGRRRDLPVTMQLDTDSPAVQVDVDAPSLFERIRKSITKKNKPPQGEMHVP